MKLYYPVVVLMALMGALLLARAGSGEDTFTIITASAIGGALIGVAVLLSFGRPADK